MTESTERIPERIRVHEAEGAWAASWPSYTGRRVDGLVSGIAMILMGALVLALSIWIMTTARSPLAPSGAAVLLLYFLASSALFVFGLMSLFNRTHARVEAGGLRMRGFPIPIPFRRWDRRDIERLETEAIIQSRTEARGTSTWTPPTVWYALVLTLRNGRKARLTRRLASWDEAAWLHTQIKRRLNLPD